VVRFLQASADADGRAPGRVSTSGLVVSDDAESVAIAPLEALYAAWTGDDEIGHPASPTPPPVKAIGVDPAESLRSMIPNDGPTGAAALLLHAVSELWGISPDAPAGVVQIRPSFPAGWAAMAIRRLRIGPTQLEIELRRRPGRVVARVGRLSGPPLTVDLSLHGPAGGGVTLDDEPLGSGRARFDADGRHEVVFHEAP